jgi:preprotein translocase SecE subunit
MGGMKVAESEEDFEREAPRPEPQPVPAAVSDRRFRTVAQGAAVVASFCAGASVYFLGTAPVTGRSIVPNVWMGVGAAVFVALTWFVAARLKPKLGYDKPGQGRWSRLSAYVGFGVIALFAAVALHRLPSLDSKWYLGEKGLASVGFLGRDFALRPVFFPAAALFLGSMLAFHVFVNRPKAAEFLVETQGEMKRVSWPTRREWIGSTIVVLVLVAILSLFLFGVDQVLSPLMRDLRIGF